MIKVCGMREAENIREAEALGIDLMGFIFWPKSSRYVSERPAYLPKKCKRVGVFVDASLEDIRQHVTDYQLDIIQLHGQESPAFAKALKPSRPSILPLQKISGRQWRMRGSLTTSSSTAKERLLAVTERSSTGRR